MKFLDIGLFRLAIVRFLPRVNRAGHGVLFRRAIGFSETPASVTDPGSSVYRFASSLNPNLHPLPLPAPQTSLYQFGASIPTSILRTIPYPTTGPIHPPPPFTVTTAPIPHIDPILAPSLEVVVLAGLPATCAATSDEGLNVIANPPCPAIYTHTARSSDHLS
jgi:hypothetical protein